MRAMAQWRAGTWFSLPPPPTLMVTTLRWLLWLILPTLTLTARAEPPTQTALLDALTLSGIELLCEQSGPMLLRGQSEARQQQLRGLYAAKDLCLDVAKRMSTAVVADNVKRAQALLDGELAKRFTELERAVGEAPEELAQYRERLAKNPPRGLRMELVKRLDQAAYTTSLASLLRYEVGKTQALIALLDRGENLDEQSLHQQTQKQAEQIKASSEPAVASFMLFAYRRMPSDQLQAYVELYEDPAVGEVLAQGYRAMEQVFADRREQLRRAAQ